MQQEDEEIIIKEEVEVQECEGGSQDGGGRGGSKEEGESAKRELKVDDILAHLVFHPESPSPWVPCIQIKHSMSLVPVQSSIFLIKGF